MNLHDISYAKSLFLKDVLSVGPELWRGKSRMTPLQSYVYLFEKKQSISMAGLPVWLWGRVEEGDDAIDIDWGYYQCGLWVKAHKRNTITNIRYNSAANLREGLGCHDAFMLGLTGCYWESKHDFLLKSGLYVGQEFLAAGTCTDSSSYEGESDTDIHLSIIWAQKPTEQMIRHTASEIYEGMHWEELDRVRHPKARREHRHG